MPSDRDDVPEDPARRGADAPPPLPGLAPEAVSALAREVVRRLAMRQKPEAGPEPEHVSRFCMAMARPDGDRTVARMAAEAVQVHGFDGLCATLLAPAARELGRMWDADRLGFAEVTLATVRLLALLRRHAPPLRRGDGRRPVVFATTPGEEHTFGVTMAAERCRANGWDVDLFTDLDHEALVARTAAAHPLAVGLSISSDRNLLALVRATLALRIALPGTPLLVVGPAAAWLDAARLSIGADAVATSHGTAVEALDRLVRRAGSQGVRSSAGTTRA